MGNECWQRLLEKVSEYLRINMKYKVEVFDENDNLIEFIDDTADGYCAEINARKQYPNYKIGKVTRIENSCEEK